MIGLGLMGLGSKDCPTWCVYGCQQGWFWQSKCQHSSVVAAGGRYTRQYHCKSLSGAGATAGDQAVRLNRIRSRVQPGAVASPDGC